MWDGSDAAVWSAERLRVAVDAAGVGLWSWDVDTGAVAMDDRGRAIWGLPPGRPLAFDDLSARVDPPGACSVGAAFAATRSTPGAYQLDFRVRHGDGRVRWVAARGRGADEGLVGRAMFAVFLDATARKEAEEARELLAGEMSHRVKNLFAVAAGLTAMAARSAATTDEMARDLTRRLSALGRAQDLIRPMPGKGERKAALLGELFAAFLAPYDTNGSVGDRVRVSLPEVRVGEAAATALALVVHEMATNSVKYGALSAPGGSLDVAGTDDGGGEVAIAWTERGGPPVRAPAGPGGFGSRLVSRSVAGQLGGSVAVDWRPGGLAATLRLSKARLAA